MLDGLISQVKLGGFELKIDRAVSIGTEIALEFYVKYRDKPKRIRLKGKVTYCGIASSGESMLRLSISQIGREDNHTLSNILQTLGDSDAFDLRA